MIKTKCLWDKPAPSDGYRILITRLWPRGKKKDFVDLWDPDLGPSKELLFSYKNGKVSWDEYDQTYRKERELPWANNANWASLLLRYVNKLCKAGNLLEVSYPTVPCEK